MAERAAHLTATVHPKPSIFDVIAQDSLNNTIHPALQKVILFLSTYNPRKYSWLTEYCDEIYLAINGLIQYYYIKKYGASFSEHFYGLTRVSALRKVKDDLTTEEQKLSLVFLVILPYLKIKIEDKLTQYRLELADGVLLNNWKRKLKRILCGGQGLFQLSWTFWTMTVYLKYMSGKNEYQNPALKILALKLTYAEVQQDETEFFSSLFRGNLSSSQLSFGLFGQALQNSLEFAAFFVQFLRSWQQEKSHVNITALPTPDPPQCDSKSSDYRGKCPICMQRWKVPTVVSISGYVYCFRCIVKHLQEYNSCPVTHLPTTMADIVRVYDS